MRVGFTELPGVAVEKMEIVEADDHEVGQCVGYRCQECGEADESLSQVFHKDDCPLAGQHGREFYGDEAALNSSSDGRRAPELDAENPLWLVTSAETDRGDDVYNGEVVGIRCECGNLDDDAFRIIHDEDCALADEECAHGTTDIEDLEGVTESELVADGGP